MKLVRWGEPGHEKPGVLDEEQQIRDVSGIVDDWHGQRLSDDSLQRLRSLSLSRLPQVSPGTRLGPCVARPGKIVCVGLNYRDHAHEAGMMALPQEPILFLKVTSAITGPQDPIEIPPGASKVDWEVELGVVIGWHGRYLTQAQVLDHVAGYCVLNDISERAWQIERGGQWDKGKCADTFAPLGPYLVTRDDIIDEQNLALWLEVDGVRRQESNTGEMIFGVAQLVAYISQFMSLQPGDIIATGTPAGVGMGFTPPVYLRPGQTLRLGIDGLGEQYNVTVAAARAGTGV
ncbi:MAG: fumarylacetoacetate hydrolase family protein [Sodalis sp. (in: enterobacteria)]|uniref:fumarylacetoacetate hydrolase family protein n=1 Tax=Sodalis sp. (in: enterobacteria) TaxID=1898979 RepID=UPI0039E30A02